LKNVDFAFPKLTQNPHKDLISVYLTRMRKSVTKFPITDAKIREIFVAAGLGEVTEIAEISDGWYNSVFSAVAESGQKYVLKIAPEKSVHVLTHEQGLMASEVAFYKLLAEKTAIITPKVVFSDFSETIIPTPYFIMNFLSGTRLDKAKLTASEKEEVKVQWAWVYSEFHKIKGTGYGYTQAGLKDNWKDGLAHMTQILIDDASSFGKKCKMGDKLLKFIDKFAAELEGVPCVCISFDLHPLNIFCQKTEDGIRLAILDLERGFWGDPVGDFTSAETFTPFAKKSIIAHYNKFAAQPIEVNRNTQIRYELLNAYLAVIMYTERFSRFKGAGKFLNPVFWIGTVACRHIAKTSFSALNKM
jgi:aminoglycoside phosphotransferase (APT) family kinase protein